MLIIFDVDGTLISGEHADWHSFGSAFHRVTGSPFPLGFFDDLPEVTARAIVHQALPQESESRRGEIEALVQAEYLAGLQAAHATDAATFRPMPGSAELLDYLDRQEGIEVAIATGDWEQTILFKTRAAGLEITKFPFATSSDRYARAEIIKLAAERAGHSLDDALYVGDGLWDYRATQKLGIPFLGTGTRVDKLLSAGVVHALQTLEPREFQEWFLKFRAV